MASTGEAGTGVVESLEHGMITQSALIRPIPVLDFS